MTIHEQFHHEAFRCDLNKYPRHLEITDENIAVCQVKDGLYNHHWWKDYIGVTFDGFMVFHIHPLPYNYKYLYEVYPVSYIGRSGIALGRPILAEYVVVCGWETNIYCGDG